MPAGPVNPEGPAHLDLGRAGERAAEALLKAKGMAVLERNWRAGRLELDLICRDRDELVFVEVKTRGPGSLAPGASAVGPGKRTKLAQAAAAYLSAHDAWDAPCRFDIVEVAGVGGVAGESRGLKAVHLENAFTLDDAPGAARFWQPF